MGVEDWSLDPDENTDINGTDISEGCPAANVNNALREIMAAVKETFDDMAEVADEALFPDWSAGTDYGVHRFVRGTDGKLYQSKAASGPSETAGAQNPVEDAARTYWAPMPEDDDNVVHKAGAETVAGSKTLSGQLNANGGIKINGLEVVAVENKAGAHNGIYRGKDLTSVYTLAQLHTKLAAGDFSDLYIGDYITKHVKINYSGTLDGETITASCDADFDFRFAHFDYWLGMGDSGSGLTSHHIVLVPDKPFFNVKMRKTNTTAGGVPATNVWTLLQGTIYNALNASGCMDGKILTHRDWIPDSVNANAPSAAGANFTGSTVYTSTMWRDVKCGLLHEPMVYGGTHFSSSGFDTGCGKSQLALFQLEPTWINCGPNRNHYWLCAVASASSFAHVNGTGIAYSYNASTTYVGVRPFFLIG